MNNDTIHPDKTHCLEVIAREVAESMGLTIDEARTLTRIVLAQLMVRKLGKAAMNEYLASAGIPAEFR